MFPLALKFSKAPIANQGTGKQNEKPCRRRVESLQRSPTSDLRRRRSACERLHVRRGNTFLAACRQSAATKSSFWRSRFTDVAKKPAMKYPPTSISRFNYKGGLCYFITATSFFFFFLPRSEPALKRNPVKSLVSATRALRQTHTLCRVSTGRRRRRH